MSRVAHESSDALGDGATGSRSEQRVQLTFRYPVAFTQAAFSPDNPLLVELMAQAADSTRARVFTVVDAGVLAAWPGLASAHQGYFAAHQSRLERVGELWTLPAGEAAKNDPNVITALHQQLFEHGLDRHSYMLALGGGALLDAAGYAAALFHRGMRLVRMPTTVLAQNDAGVGVKNGVNAFGVKNALGTFAPPHAVINDSDFLKTLPARERIAGSAEAVKVALIRDPEFFRFLVDHASALQAGDEASTRRAIARCAELHLEHIRAAGDPFESGSARPLDFGHWAAHKLELLTHHEVRHGEAVGLGMAIDIHYSRLVGMLGDAEARQACALIGALGLPTRHPALVQRDASGALSLLGGLAEFREHLGGRLTVTLLSAIGVGREVHEIDLSLMERAIEEVHAERWS